MHKQNTIPKMISDFPILLLFLFLFALNFLSRGYIFLYIAFVVFLFTSGRKVFADKSLLFLLLLGLFLAFFSPQTTESLLSVFKPFSYAIGYVIAFSLLANSRKKSKNLKFYPGSNIGKNAVFEGYNVLGINSEFTGYLGACSYIGENSKIYGKIGKFCSIGSGVRVLQGTHPTTISSKWWEMDLEWLRNHSDLFYDVSSFLQTIANENRQ